MQLCLQMLRDTKWRSSDWWQFNLTWSLTLGEEHKNLRTECWRIYLNLRGRSEQETAEKCAMMTFMSCSLQQMSLGRSKQGEWCGRGMLHACGKDKCQYGLAGNHEGKWLLGGPRRRRENNINVYLKETGWERVDRMALVNTIMSVRAS